MLSKSLTQFSVDGRGCVSSLLFDLRPNYGGGGEDNAASFRRSHDALLHSVPLPCSPPPPPTPPQRPLGTPGQVWVSLLWGHCSFLLGPGAHKILFVPSQSLFPQSCVSSVIKSYQPQSHILWEFSVPLPDPQVRKSVMAPGGGLVAKSCDPRDCSPPGSSVCGILQARILEWVCHFLLQGIFLTQGSKWVS